MANASEAISKTPTSGRRLKIVHLNNDCLERVFSYLNLMDLTNVAESNVHLAVSACNLFALKFKHLKYNCFDSRMCDETFLLALDRFGKFIQRLQIEFRVDAKRDRIIFEAIIKNCKTVTELSFSHLYEALIFDEPFPNVRKLHLADCFNGFHQSLFQLNSCFPILNSLEVYNVRDFWEKIVITRYQSLEHFGFFKFPESSTKEDAQKIAEFLHENPQLKSLAMDEINIHTSDGHVSLANIERLDVVSPHPYPNGPIEFTNLRELKLSFYAHKTDTFEKLPSTLERFELDISKLTASAFSFILSCQQNLKKLKLITSVAIESHQMEKIAVEMQALTELHILHKFSESKIPAGFQFFFLRGKNLKTIHLSYELSTFDHTDSKYKAEIDYVRDFMTTIKNRTKSNWRMTHKMYKNNHYRSRMCFMYPFVLITFRRICV